MNNSILKFLEKHNMNLEQMNQNNDFSIKSAKDINSILDSYCILKDRAKKQVSIADIKGYNYQYMSLTNYSFINNMGNFFDENGSGYEKRSLSMLDYTSDEIVEKLAGSFIREPMNLMEADNNQYIIGDNGLHRYHVLKAHYLNELSLLDKNDKEGIENLKKKYTFDVTVNELDYEKSYSYFLLKKLGLMQDKKLSVSLEYDDNYRTTGNVIVKDLNNPDFVKIFNNKELLDFLNDVISYSMTNKKIKKQVSNFIDSVQYYCDSYKSFSLFCSENLPSLSSKIKFKSNEEDENGYN